MELYVITCKVNGKRYVGVTSRSDRFATHCYNASVGRAGALYNAIRKYGPRRFTCETLRKGLRPVDAKLLEIEYIANLRTRTPHGYNLTAGGDGQSGARRSKAFCAKRSAQQRRRMRSTALRRRTSHALKGQQKPPEHLAKIAAALRGKRLSASVRAKISATLTGRTQSLATRLKRSATLRAMGHRPPPEAVSCYWSGRLKSDEHRAKLSVAVKAYWARLRA